MAARTPHSAPLAALDARLAGTANTGDTRYWRGLIQGFSGLSEDFTLLLVSNAEKPPGIPDDPRLKWLTVPASHPRLWSAWAFPNAARQLGALVLHTQYTLPPFVQKGVTTIHDVSFLIGPQWFRPKDRVLLRSLVPSSIRRAAAVLAVSETTREDICRFIPEARSRIEVTPNALGDNIRPLPMQAAQEIVARLGVAGPYALTVSTRWPRKNMELAVRAMDLLPARLPHSLVLTGRQGWGELGLGTRSRAVGYVDDQTLTALYQCADLYICPSLHEGFGIPLLEAFACGCPVVCSQGGALPEVAGGAALVVDSWDPGDWAGAIARLLDDEPRRSQLSAAGAERVRAFQWQETAAKTLQVYRKVAGVKVT